MKKLRAVLFLAAVLAVSGLPAFGQDQDPYEIIGRWSYGVICGDWFPQGLAFGIAIDSKDNVYVCDTCGLVIKKYNAFGNLITSWSPKPVNGFALIPKAIAIDDEDNVYVSVNSDLMNSAVAHVQKFNSDGDFLTEWGTPGDSPYYFFAAAGGIACGPDGHIYVIAEFGDPVVCKFDKSGNYIAGFGHWGSNDEELGFNYPTYITVNKAGEIFVSAFGEGNDSCRIKKFNSSFEPLLSWRPPDTHGPNGLIVDEEGHLLAATHDGRVLKFNAETGEFLQIVADRGTFEIHPGGIDIDSMGNVWVADESHFVTEFAPPYITVSVDIKPETASNAIDPKSNGKIPVAILTTDAFDAATVAPATVTFGKTGTEAAPWKYALEDVNGDGRLDLMLHFETQKTGLACGDTKALLKGKTQSGRAIKGEDSIQTVGCK